jgi:hypothetical protein
MKTKILSLLAAVAVSATSAFAASTVVFSHNSETGTLAGSFTASTSDIGVRKTFCIEKNESLATGVTYNYTLGDAAQAGGAGGGVSPIVGGKDYLSLGSAWLIRQYALGILTGYNYGTSTTSNKLQNAFWMLEGEINWNPGANSFVQLAQAALGGSLLNNAYGAFGGKVMTVWATNSRNPYRQDMVVFVPDTASTVALLGLALSAVAFVARRRS